MSRKPLLTSFEDLRAYGMHGAYLLLLHTCSSVNELRFLHDQVIPPDCRLMREDVILLEDAFRARQKIQGWPRRQGRWDMEISYPARDAFLRDFNLARSVEHHWNGFRNVADTNLCSYYHLALIRGRTFVERHTMGGMQILSDESAFGHGHFHFLCLLTEDPDVVLPFGVFWDANGFFVLFRVSVRNLTEPMTHAIRQAMPESARLPSMGKMYGQVDLVVDLPDKRLVEHVTERQIGVSQYTSTLAGDGFLGAVQNVFDDMGLKVTVTEAITYPQPEDDSAGSGADA